MNNKGNINFYTQVNLKMEKYRHFTAMKNLPDVDLFPILWADEGADMDESSETKFKGID